jgi:hypothetical protein
MRYTRTSSCRHTARNIRDIGQMADVGDGLVNTRQSISKKQAGSGSSRGVLISLVLTKVSGTYRCSRAKISTIPVVWRWEGSRI